MGSVLVENPEDEDGFTLHSREAFAKNFAVTKESIAPAVNFRPMGPK